MYNCLRLCVPCVLRMYAYMCVAGTGDDDTGQYYAQRVIGNYYIRKAQDYQKRGITRVDLHAS